MKTVVFFTPIENYEQSVTGESNYQSTLKKAHETDGKIVEVNLQLEDSNQFDKNAVLVAYGVDTVGYLPREDAVIYRQSLLKIGHPQAVGMCKAKIIGGNGKHYGIILDIDIADPQVQKISVPNVSAIAPQSPAPKAASPTKAQPVSNKSFFQNIAEFWGKGLINKIVLLVAAFVITCSCLSASVSVFSPSASAEPTQDVNAVSTNAMLTAWAPFTQTAAAIPTNTATPENTPTPESTPTNTPPPTATPAPIVLTGSGDMIVDVPDGGAPRVLHAKYSSGSNFIIQNYDSNNQPIDLLVNTIGVYDGKVPLDFLDNQFTARLEIKASGPWEIILIPLAQARIESVPGIIQGVGDDVIIINGFNVDIVNANASSATSNFIVYSYSDDGIDLVFNEIAPYTGTAFLDSSTFMVTVKAEGSWSLDITTK